MKAMFHVCALHIFPPILPTSAKKEVHFLNAFPLQRFATHSTMHIAFTNILVIFVAFAENERDLAPERNAY
jgi:hypothetical protein